jgi:Protein of unknown function (DUF1449)
MRTGRGTTMPQLLEWYYLIFELPLGLGLMYLAMYTLSGWTFGDADADASGFDHDMDAHLDANVDHDADLSQDIHADADTDTDTDASETDAHSSPGAAFLSALNWIGVGRMPLSLVLMILMLCWGTLGFGAMQLQHEKPLQSSTAFAIAVAGVGSLIITHFISAILGKALFSTGNISRRRHELLGSLGEALYPIDEKFGMVTGRDDRGELFQVACRIEEGKPPVAKGAPVQLVAYTAKEQMFYVVPAESSNTPRRALNA